jgi:hypothetical protein
MKTPLIFKAILLLVFAWRLIVSNKKAKSYEVVEYPKFNQLKNISINKPEFKLNYIQSIVSFYREEVRSNPNRSQLYFMVFMADKLFKNSKKGGIFRTIWYDNPMVLAIHESLIVLKLENELHFLEKILNRISPNDFLKLKNGQPCSANAFMPAETIENGVFKDFDAIFDLEKYCEALFLKFYE